MGYLLIENKGELDISSLVLLGASTKRNSTDKIGFFGSGNKYAIATLIRHNIEFKIFSGERLVNIDTVDVSFRDMNFKQIIIDGQQTSLTTDMGPQWEPWMAVREWVSNSIDEGAYNIISNAESASGREGYTRIYVEHHESIKTVIEEWHSYFTFDRDDAVASTPEGKLFPHTEEDNNVVLYRKGIRCFFDKGVTSLYQYDLPTFEINESRLVDSLFNAEYRAVKFLNKVPNVSVLRNVLKRAFVENTWEGRMSWRYGINNLEPLWRDAIGNAVIIVDNVSGHFVDIQRSMECYIVNLEMAQQIRKSFPDVKIYGLADDGTSLGYSSIDATAKQEFLLKECVKFCEETNYSINYPIELVKFDDNNILGRAHAGKILLSDRVFDEGKKQIVMTIIEENEHLNTGYKDCTRAFQNHLFNLFLTEKEERYGFFL